MDKISNSNCPDAKVTCSSQERTGGERKKKKSKEKKKNKKETVTPLLSPNATYSNSAGESHFKCAFKKHTHNIKKTKQPLQAFPYQTSTRKAHKSSQPNNAINAKKEP